MVESSLGVYDVSSSTVIGIRILLLVSMHSLLPEMVTDLVEMVSDMIRDLFLRRIDESIPGLPELIREVIEHARGFLHPQKCLSIGVRGTGHLEPSRLSCSPEPKCAIIKNGEGIRGHVWDCDPLSVVVRSWFYDCSYVSQ